MALIGDIGTRLACPDGCAAADALAGLRCSARPRSAAARPPASRRRAHGPAAEGPLRPLDPDRRAADPDPAGGRRLCLHGAALADGDAPAVERADARHRRASSRSSRPIRRTRASPRSPRIAADTYGLTISVLPPDPLPEAGPAAVLLAARLRRCRARSAGASTGPSGSTRSAIPTWSRSASPSTTTCCASSRRAAAPMPRTRTSSCSGWSARRWC